MYGWLYIFYTLIWKKNFCMDYKKKFPHILSSRVTEVQNTESLITRDFSSYLVFIFERRKGIYISLELCKFRDPRQIEPQLAYNKKNQLYKATFSDDYQKSFDQPHKVEIGKPIVEDHWSKSYFLVHMKHLDKSRYFSRDSAQAFQYKSGIHNIRC